MDARINRITRSLLTALLFLGTQKAVAHQDPPGCEPSGFASGGLGVFRADGVTRFSASEPVRPCETIQYQFAVEYRVGSNDCGFQGGTMILVTPDGVFHDTTPTGGVPLISPQDGVLEAEGTKVSYTVTSQDIVNGKVTAIAFYGCALGVNNPPGCQDPIDHSGPDTSDTPGFPTGSTGISRAVQPCPEGLVCQNSFCDPTATDGVRTGMCVVQDSPRGMPCPNPDTHSCVMARCAGPGNCMPGPPELVPPGTACEDRDGNDCTAGHCDAAGTCNPVVTLGKECPDTDGNDCTFAQCDATGTCNQLNNERAGTLCLDTDGNPCTMAQCDGNGTCNQSPGRLCDDGDECTDDICDPRMGCQHARKPGCHICGNTVVELNEECDLGSANGTKDSCCTDHCTLREPEYKCLPAQSDCQRDAICQRSDDGTCPRNEPQPSDHPCDDGDLCTAGDHCQNGTCVGRDRICDASPFLKRLPRQAVPHIAVECDGIPFQAGAFCEVEDVVLENVSPALLAKLAPLPRRLPLVANAVENACAPDAKGRVRIARKRRRPLKQGMASVDLPLNACGRRAYKRIGAGEHMSASVPVMLGNVTTGDPACHDVSLRQVVDIARGVPRRFPPGPVECRTGK